VDSAHDTVFDTLGAAVRNAMPLGRHDAPGAVGSSFIAGWYGIVHKDLRGVLAGAPVAPFSRLYCGNGVLADCRTAVKNSLSAAVAGLIAQYGSNPTTGSGPARRSPSRPTIASGCPRPALRRFPTWTGSIARPSSRRSSTGSIRRA